MKPTEALEILKLHADDYAAPRDLREAVDEIAREVERLKRCEEASVQMRDYLVDQIIPEAESGEPVDGMLKYALENTQWWDWLPSEPNTKGSRAEERE